MNTSISTEISKIPIDHVLVGPRLRQLRQETVKSLADSIDDVGLLNPILVVPFMKNESSVSVERYRLLAGYHRLEACKLLGWKEIPASQVQMHEVDQRLIEIDENLCRAELTHLERAEHLAERKTLYEIKYPQTRHGACGGGKNGIGTRERTETDIKSFSADIAQKTRATERNIRRDVRRANNISQEVRDSIRNVPSIADNTLELDALANLEEPEQKAAVQAVLGGKIGSIREVARQKEESAHPPVTHPPHKEQTGATGSDNKEASSEVMAAKGNIRTLKRQLSELKTRIKELESVPPMPVAPSADLETWKARALEAEEGCIVLQHRMTEIEHVRGSTPNQGSRGIALRSLLDELETALKTTPAEFRPDVLDWFEDCFMNLVFLIKNIKRRTN